MGKAVRAIIIENGRLLVMRRSKYGSEYYTLVGGRVNEGETSEQALVREVREETTLVVTAARLVYTEDHPSPYNTQSIYLCTVAPHGAVGLELTSEEAMMNTYGMNLHQPLWVAIDTFDRLPFRTPALHEAINTVFKKSKKGQLAFPVQPIKL
jgi:ADP-ribose pyrophosphatase YjhB (NUDIX family)